MKETRFKQTEIGLIPEDWEVVTISKIAETSSGGTPSRSINRYYNGNIRWITTSELKDSRIYDSIEHITEEAVQNSSAKMFPKGTVLMAMYGATIGKLGILEVCSTTNQACCAIICRDIKNIYLFYYLFFIRKEIILQGCGAGQPNISQNIVKNINIGLPKEIEQKKIASALTSIDNLLLSLDKLIEKKRLIKQGAMQELLTGKKRLPGFAGEWVERRLGDIGFTYTGLSGKNKDDFQRGNARYIPFLNVLNNPIIDTKDLEKVKINIGENQNKVLKDDLLFNTSSETPDEVGICSLMNTDIDNLYLNSFCFGFRIISQNINGLYLSYYFRSRYGRDLMIRLAQGATRYNLPKAQFLLSSIKIPNTYAEQKAISEVILSMDKEIESLEGKKAKYEQIKQGMMQQLLTGKIRLIS